MVLRGAPLHALPRPALADDDASFVLGWVRPRTPCLVLAVVDAVGQERAWALLLPRVGRPGWAMVART